MHKYTSFLVFHGGSGSTKDEIKVAVQNGVVKMNVDTDTQFAYLVGMRVSQSSTQLVYSNTNFTPRTSSRRMPDISNRKSGTLMARISPTRRLVISSGLSVLY